MIWSCKIKWFLQKNFVWLHYTAICIISSHFGSASHLQFLDDRSWKKATTVMSPHFHFHYDRSLSSITLQGLSGIRLFSLSLIAQGGRPLPFTQSIICFLLLFLAVQNSSIGDLVTQWVTEWVTFWFWNIRQAMCCHWLELMTSYWFEQDIWDNFWQLWTF